MLEGHIVTEEVVEETTRELSGGQGKWETHAVQSESESRMTWYFVIDRVTYTRSSLFPHPEEMKCVRC